MHLRTSLSLVAASLLAVIPSPANAEPVVSADTSVPGMVTASVTGLGAEHTHVRFQLRNQIWPDTELPGEILALDNGATTTTLPAWGLISAWLDVATCESATGGCTALNSIRLENLPPAAPIATWDTDTLLGPEETLSVAISDPEGGGSLWSSSSIGGLKLPREGTIELPSIAGPFNAYIERCQFDAAEKSQSGPCRIVAWGPYVQSYPVFALTRAYINDRSVGWQATDIDLYLNIEANAVPFELAWEVYNAESGQPTGVQGAASANIWRTSLPLSLDGLASGTYEIRTKGNFDLESVGTMESTRTTGTFVVDNDPPDIVRSGKSHRKFYPVVDDYHDKVTVTGTASGSPRWRLEILDQAGNLVREIDGTSFTKSASINWNGRASGELVPEGTYRMRLVAIDKVGNETKDYLGEVVVSHRKTKWVDFSKKLTIKQGLYAKGAKRCSSLRIPSSHGWTGSIGLQANTKCGDTSVAASMVWVTVRMQLPAGLEHRDLGIDVYGGAAKPRSQAGTATWNAAKGKWFEGPVLSPTVGNHAVLYTLYKPAALIDSKRFVYAQFYTNNRLHYDLKSFNVDVDTRVWAD